MSSAVKAQSPNHWTTKELIPLNVLCLSEKKVTPVLFPTFIPKDLYLAT